MPVHKARAAAVTGMPTHSVSVSPWMAAIGSSTLAWIATYQRTPPIETYYEELRPTTPCGSTVSIRLPRKVHLLGLRFPLRKSSIGLLGRASVSFREVTMGMHDSRIPSPTAASF